MELLNKYSIHEFADLDYHVLKNEYGIGEVKAMILICSIEFAKRIYNKKYDIIKINDSNDIYNVVKNDLEQEPQEHFCVIFLNAKNEILKIKTIFIGTINSSNIYARDIFREALKCNAFSMIFTHNHPSGNPIPSIQDTYMTNNLIKLGNMMNIYVLDHLIIGKDDYYSFREDNPQLFQSKE